MTMMPPVPGMPVPNHQADAVPWAYVDLTLQGSTLTAWGAPQVFVNGWLVPAAYGLSTVPVPAGHCRVDVISTVARRRSSLAFAIAPQQHVPVYYAQPAATFFAGAIGHTAQFRPGWWVGVLGLVAVIAIPLVAILAS